MIDLLLDLALQQSQKGRQCVQHRVLFLGIPLDIVSCQSSLPRPTHDGIYTGHQCLIRPEVVSIEAAAPFTIR